MAENSTATKPTREAASKGKARELRMVEAAIEEFAERGFEGATWRSIAERAGVSQGLIKFYFNDKEGLWQAALMRAHDLLSEDLPPPPFTEGETLSLEKTADWIRAYVHHAARHPQYIKMTMREASAPNPRLAWAVQNLIRESNKQFQDGIEELQKRGFFPNLNPVLVEYAFLGAIHHPFLASEEIRAVYGMDILSNKMIDAHCDTIIGLFLGNPLNPAADDGAEKGRKR
ncbi:TetR/AcrR family transcriptional regulator [Microbulbifer sp. YPW1]|uniref:TetR/AcrR family transcriptional regulator n=1 Tax=Microbulbifer sp. YPW1 TaxID=2745199 RepID=UPI00159813E0|nr:TetR/AcrR family transcriptional regulator [Microbulbifer sp. YPW1]QKX17199.1 TetR/AcrR family transcriptional regulator [Microbulbifer sp. YPW1]